MDFFSHQEKARRNTRRLVALFVLAVAAIVVAVHLAVAFLFFTSEAGELMAPGALWAPEIFLPVTAGTLLVIGGGSLYKTWQLSEGGPAVGRLLGGRPLDPNTTKLEERRILNVVEEMALASGTPVPEVYLLDDERSINAFAAGRTRDDAVVGITRGTARLLSRDELQGVVAHEFSHILNGDMRLNLRLMGVLHGILVISMIGYFIFRGSGRSSGRRKKGGGAIVLLGLALYVIGWIGVFFGRLIKAGVSRQREFLADAAAVQFTRNPGGIGGALRKIGGYGNGSRIGHRRAEEASHLFFSNALKKGFLGLTATHPPLDERIRRIDPAFDGTFPEVRWPGEGGASPPAEPMPAAAAAFAGQATHRGGAEPAAAPAPPPGIDRAAGSPGERRASALANELTASAGTLDRAHIAWASTFLADLPEDIREAAREPAAARGLAFALLLDPDPEVRGRQLGALGEAAEPAVVLETRRLLPRVQSVGREARLPLLELALPALRRMSPEQYRGFRAAVRTLADADGRVSLFEYALHRMLLRHLDPRYRKAGQARGRTVQYYSLRGLATETSCLLSLLARAGHPETEAAEALAAGARELDGGGAEVELLPPEACGLKDLDRALERLALAAPKLKEKVLRAAVAAVVHDRRVTAAEAELLRAVADGLDCPVPPFLSAEASP